MGKGRVARLLAYLAGSSALALTACAGGGDESATSSGLKPHLIALSTYGASLGTPVDAYIANPPAADATKIELVFDGTFTHPDGRVENVHMAQETARLEAGAVRWGSFGPFSNPFAPTNPDVGKFDGKVAVQVTNADGTIVTDDRALPVSFEVKPSILIEDLQPTSATCDKPALRLIGSLGYKMKATTIGFKAKSIAYAMTTPSIVPDPNGMPTLDIGADGTPNQRTTNMMHELTAPSDTVDDKDGLVLPPVPDDQPNYGVIFVVTAKDDQGRQIASSFGMTAHKPLEVYYDGRYQLAQIYAPEPVSGCMPGGQQGRTVDYSEATTETRARSLSVTLSQTLTKTDENNWSTSDGKTVTTSKTTTNGFSNTHGTQNTFSFTRDHSNTNGVSFNWSDSQAHTSGWEGGGEAGVSFKPFGVGVDLGGSYKRNGSDTNTSTQGGSTTSSSTDGWSQGQANTTLDQSTTDHSDATTDSTAVAHTDTKGGANSTATGTGQAVQDVWTVSSSDTIQRGFAGQVVAGTQGVFYRQMARYTRRAFVLQYNKCGEADVVGDLTMQDYVWAPDLALSNTCPPLPKSNFPEPQCYLPPCDP
jgi:hypothetical protein